MDLFIDRDALGRGLARIQGIIERRTTQQLLSHVLLHARGNTLRMTATDSEVAYIGEVEANVRQDGELAVDAAGLFQIIRALPEAVVHLTSAEGPRLHIVSGRSTFNLVGVAAADYPALPPFSQHASVTLAEADLRRLVEQTQFSVASEDVRWGLNGAHLEEVTVQGERRVRFVATDGHRLALAEAPFQGDFGLRGRMLVPRKALGVLRKLLEGEAASVSLDFGDGSLQLRLDRETFWFRLLDGEFPDYKAVIPSSHRHRATLRRSDLASTLRRVGILASDRSRPVKFAFREDELEVNVRNVDRGEVRETVPVELDGAAIEVGFNARYLQEILGVIAGDRVVLEFAAPLAPCLVRDADTDDCQFVVMPMRLD